MEWLAMGKYGAYVWSSFGLTFAVVIVCAVQARRRHDAVTHEIKRQIKIMETR